MKSSETRPSADAAPAFTCKAALRLIGEQRAAPTALEFAPGNLAHPETTRIRNSFTRSSGGQRHQIAGLSGASARSAAAYPAIAGNLHTVTTVQAHGSRLPGSAISAGKCSSGTTRAARTELGSDGYRPCVSCIPALLASKTSGKPPGRRAMLLPVAIPWFEPVLVATIVVFIIDLVGNSIGSRQPLPQRAHERNRVRARVRHPCHFGYRQRG